jgi:deoxyribose-phosphate aldolase
MGAGRPRVTQSDRAADRDLSPYIDHTLLRPEAPPAAFARLVAEAAAHGFAAVCLPPVHVAAAARALAGTSVRTCTVIAFPFGYVPPEIRIAESRRAISDGAQELDTVMNLSWLAGGEDQRVLDDLAAWVAAARAERGGLTLKVILETTALAPDQKVRAARLAAAAGADLDRLLPAARQRRDGRGRRPPRPHGRPCGQGQGLRRHPRRRDCQSPDRRRRQPPGHLQQPADRWRRSAGGRWTHPLRSQNLVFASRGALPGVKAPAPRPGACPWQR